MKGFSRRQFLNAAAAVGATVVTGGAGALYAAPSPAPAASSRLKEPWSGVFIIMQTPFLDTPGKEIDGESLRRETDFLCRCGVHGMVWPAGAGEYNTLSMKERLKFAEVVVKEARDRTPVMIGVHGANAAEAVEYARNAEKIGAHGMLALPPTQGKVDEKMVTDYYTAITQTSKLPLCIMVQMPELIDPQKDKDVMSVDYLIGLARKLPTIRYLKEEIRPVPYRISRYANEAKDVLVPMTGGGSRNLLNEMARGSRGTMPGAGFADIQAQIWDWYVAGKKKEARDLFAKMLMMAVLELHTGYVLQKEILRRRGVFKTITMRAERGFAPMDQGDLNELSEIFEVLRPYFRVKS